MTTVLRWFLVPVSAIAAFFAAVLTAALIDWVYWKFDYPCPRNDLTDAGACLNGSSATYDWLMNGYYEILGSIGAGIAAIYIVVACTLVAPQYKARTAVATFVVGTVVAISGLLLGAGFGPPVSAVLSGAIAAYIMSRKYVSASVA